MKLEPGRLHTNQGYGDFLPCPFCGRDPMFSVRLYSWADKAANHLEDNWDEVVPDDPAGFNLGVTCLNCTISMKEVHTPPTLRNWQTEAAGIALGVCAAST